MNQTYDFFSLFKQFVCESQSGKRLKRDGSKIRLGTIKFYNIVRQDLLQFSQEKEFHLRIHNVLKLAKRDLKKERLYWKRFYRKYSDYLYSNGCFDNYVGAHFKVVRTFFNYLKQEKAIFTGDFNKNFYVRNETIPITVLSAEQMQFLIHNKEFELSLPLYLKRTKDVFVFGCTVGLRFSDLVRLTNKNIEKANGNIYLRTRSVKTATDTRIKIPEYAIAIMNRYKRLKTLLPMVSKNRLNLNVKELCEKAGWTYEIGKQREKRGVVKNLTREGKVYRFCDLVTTHTMRRTAITTLLSLGMPEIMVRKISGHSANGGGYF